MLCATDAWDKRGGKGHLAFEFTLACFRYFLFWGNQKTK